jgi:hypothetical protein
LSEPSDIGPSDAEIARINAEHLISTPLRPADLLFVFGTRHGVGAFVAQRPDALASELRPEQLFVLSRALIGSVRAAVMEEAPFLRSSAFEDEVVRLVVAYLQALPR